jgi:hypothetical protein
MRRKAVDVEVLLHRERGAEQADRTQPGVRDCLRGDVPDVQKRYADGVLHLVCDFVHRVGAEE